MENKNRTIILAALFSITQAPARAAEPASAPAPTSAPAPAAEISPSGTSMATGGPSLRHARYQARFSYITSRTAEHDVRAFRGSATDDTGAVTEGSTLPNLNYFSARLSVSPLASNTFSFGALQSLDSAQTRAEKTFGSASAGGGFGPPSSVWSARYSYRFDPHFTFGAGQTYVAGRKFSDPSLSFNYRARSPEDQGWSPRAGVGLTVPTTERSHNDQLITRATARTGLSYAAGRWTSSASLSYSRPLYAHPEKLSASNWDDGSSSGSGSGQVSGAASPSFHGGHGHGHGHGRNPSDTPADTSAGTPEPVYVPTAAEVALSERERDRTTGSVGLAFHATDHLRLSTGAGVTYLETWRQKAVWMTNARLLSASYSFWKMEAGSDVNLYSTTQKFAHPSLPKMMAVGLHLTYFMGAERGTQL